jgi:wobble nucleotide-excising tRNase
MTHEEHPGENARFDAEYADYQRRARNIDDWARAQYAAGKMSEAQIERRVEAMFDALDADYTGPCIDRIQTRADFYLEE